MNGRHGWLLVIGGARRGGAEGQFVRLAAELRSRGEPVECIFLYGGGPLLDQLDAAGVPWVVLRGARGDSRRRPVRMTANVIMLFRLAALLVARRPAVVMAWLTAATWPTLLLADLLTPSRRVAGIRGEILKTEVRWAGPLFRLALRRAHAVVVNSESLVQEAKRWGARGVHVIPNGVDMQAQRSTSQSTTSVVVANYRYYKGHDDLLRALEFVQADHHVRLCGSGDGRAALEKLALQLGVERNVTFVHQPADIPAELRRAGFAVHPSRTEGLSNAILEEMAAGLPVIAMDVGGNSALVKDGRNGYLLALGDHIGLARKMDELARSQSLRLRMGHESRQLVEQFSWSACAGRYQELLNSWR